MEKVTILYKVTWPPDYSTAREYTSNTKWEQFPSSGVILELGPSEGLRLDLQHDNSAAIGSLSCGRGKWSEREGKGKLMCRQKQTNMESIVSTFVYS